MAYKAKKSQGMPINVIIISALALIVLVILAAMFSGKVKLFSKTLEDCRTKQGSCHDAPCGPNEAVITNTECPKSKNPQACCIAVLST
ncbi:hypothetical protein HYS31_00515 [Candidatus Woesearchaeota archaeon]|nr:hypothetical protein [Candidatus Woesearchaeota archaeon]